MNTTVRTRLKVAVWGIIASLLLLAGCAPTPVQEDFVPPVRAPRETPAGHLFEYKIRPGDTLYAIARRFGVEWQELLVANPGLKTRDLRVGQEILIPTPSITPKPPLETTPVQPAPTEEPAPTPERYLPLVRKHPGHKGPIQAETTFVWPVRGRILAPYGKPVPWRQGEPNRGIDIAPTVDHAVRAAKSGRINIFRKLPGYGRTVLLEHTDGTATLYGNLGEILVPHWRWIKQGETLGIIGTSAAADQLVLHFRVMRGEEFLNPASVLPQ